MGAVKVLENVDVLLSDSAPVQVRNLFESQIYTIGFTQSSISSRVKRFDWFIREFTIISHLQHNVQI